jgi:hypothetical protein
MTFCVSSQRMILFMIGVVLLCRCAALFEWNKTKKKRYGISKKLSRSCRRALITSRNFWCVVIVLFSSREALTARYLFFCDYKAYSLLVKLISHNKFPINCFIVLQKKKKINKLLLPILQTKLSESVNDDGNTDRCVSNTKQQQQ